MSSGVLAMMYKLEGGQYSDSTRDQYSAWYIAFLTVQSCSTVYSYVWDIYMDWGLVRCKEKGKYALRPTINYAPWFYYYCMVSDLLLRCTWTITAFIDLNGYPWLTGIGYGTLIGVLELFRRWQWSLVRIENEQVNNLEKYRHILDIPEIREVERNEGVEEQKYKAIVKAQIKAMKTVKSE
jgi:EXS family